VRPVKSVPLRGVHVAHFVFCPNCGVLFYVVDDESVGVCPVCQLEVRVGFA
jgi:hypothetical protein